MAPSATEPKAAFHTAHARRELAPASDLLDAFETLRRDPEPWLLDSALAEPSAGRFSFAGSDPYLILRAFVGRAGCRVKLECRRGVRPDLARGRRVLDGDPFETLRALLPPAPDGDLPDLPFLGGAVGYFGYELASQLESVRFHARDDLGLPDLELWFVDRLLALDHTTGRLLACALGFGTSVGAAREQAERAAEALAARVAAAPPACPRPAGEGGAAREPSWRAFFDEAAYARAVDAIQRRIAAGDVYQGCLTHRLDAPFVGDPWALYRTLRRINPAPFASYLEMNDVTVVSSSPERFLRLLPDRRVQSRPIKGTRPRGESRSRDAALRRELERSRKDRAENLMIVDLVRNDLGRVCEIGSIEVPELFEIEAYASVFQMVSTVEGRLRADRDAVDLVRAAFPPGSMTGAPKLAALRILDELEPVRRGIYSGALGYLDVRGGADLSVVIRTLLVQRGRAYLHVGGGIVADSDPVAEYRESLDKARALWAALAEHAPPDLPRGEEGGTTSRPASSSVQARSAGSALRIPSRHTVEP